MVRPCPPRCPPDAPRGRARRTSDRRSLVAGSEYRQHGGHGPEQLARISQEPPGPGRPSRRRHRRRVPRRRSGLRREEVARLAGISVDYYARLEQARGPRPSRQVLGALGRALRLHDDERTYLFQVAGEQPGLPAGPSHHVSEGIRHLLDRLDDTPAFVIDAKYDLLAWNPMAAALIGDPAVMMPGSRNMIWNLFSRPGRPRRGRDVPVRRRVRRGPAGGVRPLSGRRGDPVADRATAVDQRGLRRRADEHQVYVAAAPRSASTIRSTASSCSNARCSTSPTPARR